MVPEKIAVSLVEEESGRMLLGFLSPASLGQPATKIVTTGSLGRARIPDLPYENADGSPLRVDIDFFGKGRSDSSPTPGPFENPGSGPIRLTGPSGKLATSAAAVNFE